MENMKRQATRRDFLKVTGALPAGLAASHLLKKMGLDPLYQQERRNVIVIVFDAFSAYNISIHGYSRETTPNIARIAKRAIVYHNHFAGGNFTTPGTASLLTGVLPWTHRAFQPKGEVAEPFVTRNLFGAFPDHYSMAYTHNGWAGILLNQFADLLDEYIPREKLLLGSDDIIHALFRKDDDTASLSWLRNSNVNEQGYAYSLLLSHFYQEYQEKKIQNLKPLFPRGLPTAGSLGSDNIFMLEPAVDYLTKRLMSAPRPFIGYFHFLPPHDPYRTSSEFYDYFRGDGFNPPEKPFDIFATRVHKDLLRKRTEYDEFILYCDKEFGRLYDQLESSGLLEDTWLILTSDHGEMNERGISGHSTNALYQPVIRIPLMIFEPGREVGVDIHENTSAIDLLPTLAYLTGQKIPDWTEGVLLPPFASSGARPDRSIYVVRANDNAQYAPLTQASTMLVRENYKLLYYFGYPEVSNEGLVKLFDIRADPEELNDLFSSQKGIAGELLNELKTKLAEVNEPYL